MPVNIQGEIYNMEKIEELTKKKVELLKKAAHIVDRLKSDFINEEKLDQKSIMDEEKFLKILKEKIASSKFIIPVGKTYRQLIPKEGKIEEVNIRKCMYREEEEFSEEIKLVSELHAIIVELKRLTDIEKAYFEHHIGHKL